MIIFREVKTNIDNNGKGIKTEKVETVKKHVCMDGEGNSIARTQR